MDNKKAYADKMQARLDELTAEVSRLKAKVDKAGAEQRIQLQPFVEKIEANSKTAKDKLVRLRDASDDAWDDMKAGFEGAWERLAAAKKVAETRFH